MSLAPRGASARSRSPHGASSRSLPADRGKYPGASSRNTPLNWPGSRGPPSSRSPSPQGAVSRSPSPEGVCSSSPSPQRAPSRSLSPHGVSSRSRSPHGTSSRSRPTGRGRSPLTSSSRNKTHNGADSRGQPPKRSPSPQGAVSRSPSPQGATSRSLSPERATSRSPSPRGATSRSPSPQGATSRSPSPQGATSRSPSPQGAVSRSPSPQGVSSKSGDRISPSINQNSEDEDGVSAASPGADADPKALASHGNSELYGVKVSNLYQRYKNKRVQSYLTEHFMPYGNVFCVTIHGTDRNRYGLVFYKQKREQEKALKADTNSPHNMKLCITPWSGPLPCIFGIVVTGINDNYLDVRDRVRTEFSIFGDIDSVMLRGLVSDRFALVFYKDRKGQEKALATQNPFKTSFGEVTLHAWNRPLPSKSEMSHDDIFMAVGYSPNVATLTSQRKDSLHQPAKWNVPREAIPPRVWHGSSLPIQPRHVSSWHQPASGWNGPQVAIPLPVWHEPPFAIQPRHISSWHQPASGWIGPQVAIPLPVWHEQSLSTQSWHIPSWY